jgi:hypothetical protein
VPWARPAIADCPPTDGHDSEGLLSGDSCPAHTFLSILPTENGVLGNTGNVGGATWAAHTLVSPQNDLTGRTVNGSV